MRKRFVKLLLFKVDTQYRLLYGFSSETEQSSYLWKAFPADKKGQKLIVKAILSPSEADNFSINLTGTEPIMLCERVTLKSPQLYKREQLLYSDDEEQQTVPISEFCYLSEFWNREKHSLLSEIQNEFSADGRTRYEQTLELLEWAKCNCGIDFCMDGRRFGNYEVYYRTPENSSFEIDIHKDQGLRVTTIRKRKDFAEDIIVNCIGKYKDYVICNQTQVWPANKKEIYFEANEPMTSVVVHAWNAATGKLIVSQSIALMMGLSIISRWGGTPYQIGDSWTNKLLHSAAKSSELIRTQLMKVQRITTDRAISIRSEHESVLDEAMEDGYSLFKDYQGKKETGAFISNAPTTGEIDSFLQVRAYIEQSSVCKAVIADPYFSARAAEKLLTRIQRTDLELEIITSLGSLDPDTNQKSNVCEETRAFLQRTAPLLHNNLVVRNLTRGEKGVFHDRYLIRYHKDGTIDGFLLSNSLNSMAQKFPLVIAPLEHRVCMEVCEYLNSLSDSDIQQQKPRALRISNEVLFSSETYRCQVQSETSAESAAERYLRQWYDELSNQICICKDDFSTVLTAVAERAQSDRIDACKMLCYALSNICTSQVESLTEMLQSTGGVKALFLSEFPNLAKAAEQQCDYLKCGASSPEYTLWALLNGKARPSPQGYHLLIDHAGHIHLRGLTWLTCGYHMALKLDITGFLTLLSQLRSPMMFDTLAFQMAISPLDRELYCAAACSELLYVRLLSAEWLFNAIRDERSQFEVAREIWNRFEPDVRALQEAIVLSNVVFHVRTRRLESEAQWQAIQEVLLSKLASDLPACSGEVINTALDWLHDSNAVSRATLLMTLAERMENSHPQKQLLARAERILKREIQDCQTASDIPRSIGNMTLAAIPIIYANVHFRTAILTEKQARQRVDFPVPVGAFDGRIFQNPLYGFKVGAVNNRLMHIFGYLPLAPVYIVVPLVPEMLCSLEVDYIAAILLPCEDIGQGGFVPLAAVILVERLIFTGSPPAVFHVESGGRDLLLCQIYGDLVAVLPTDKQTENKAYNLGGFLVDYPKILVVRVFDIAVRGFGDNRLSTHAFGLNARFHFLADVLCVPLRHDVDKGRKLQCIGLFAVYPVVDCDKAHIVPSEYLHRIADLEIVTPPACQVFHNADTDFPVLYIVHHAGVGRTVKKSAAFVIVNVVPDIG